MVLGPLIANGLYAKSRSLEKHEHVTFRSMVFVHMRSGYSAFFMGAMLLGLFMLWIRAAVLIYALFFGVVDFPGTGEVLPMLLTTPTGWGMLLVGGCVGALFAAFAFAISVFAVPMLLEEDTDALTALGTSMAMVWNNRRVMMAWGAIVLVLFAVSVLTGIVGLIVIFPVLGHATWHAYRSIRGSFLPHRDTERCSSSPPEFSRSRRSRCRRARRLSPAAGWIRCPPTAAQASPVRIGGRSARLELDPCDVVSGRGREAVEGALRPGRSPHPPGAVAGS